MIRFENIEVTFGDFTAIPSLDLQVEPGEFFTLLGPSGCGKTTALRTLAGFIEPSAGEVYVDGKDVTRLPSDKRQVGMVFQNYALFPSMSVWENIAFGLRVRKEKPAESDRLVRDIARRVDLVDDQLRKNVAELSGGQQQRVAVARALVLQPKILLLDEPLSNLDAKLRHQLRQQLKDLQSEFGITTVYVTHDQDEALAMSDRVAVFNKGVVEQIGTPQSIYDESATEFVCNFIGDSSRLTAEFVAELNRQSAPVLNPAANSYLRVEKASLDPAGGGRLGGPGAGNSRLEDLSRPAQPVRRPQPRRRYPAAGQGGRRDPSRHGQPGHGVRPALPRPPVPPGHGRLPRKPAAGSDQPVSTAGGSNGASTRSMLRSPAVLIVGVVLTWFIAAFLVWPNANVLIQTFFPDGSFSGRAAEKLFSSQRAMKSLGNSFLLAVALSITVNVVGIFIVLVTQYFRIRGSRVLFLGYATTFIYGGIVLAAGYKFIYGDKGIVTGFLLGLFPGMDPGWFSGFFAVLAVMTFATTTNHMLFVANALKGVDYQTIEAARNMGASTWTILRRIVLPMLKPTLFAVTILSFLTGLGALSAPQVLGGREFQTITPMILTFSNSPTSRDLAALLAVILGVATILMLAVMTRLEKGGTYFSVSKVSSGTAEAADHATPWPTLPCTPPPTCCSPSTRCPWC